MKITIKAKGKDPENNEEELQKKQQLEELQRAEAEKELAAKAKQAQIDSLLEHFEKEAADSPELIKDKDSYFNSKEFNDLSNENFDFNKKRRAELEDRVVHLEDVYDQEKKKSKNTIPWRNYLVYLMIITSLSCCVTFSKYIATANGGSQGTIAKFDVKLGVTADNGSFVDIESAKTSRFDFGEVVLDPITNCKMYPLTIENGSEVTIKVRFETSTLQYHKFKFGDTSGGPNDNLSYITVPARTTKTAYLYFYSAEETISESLTLDMIVEQVD